MPKVKSKRRKKKMGFKDVFKKKGTAVPEPAPITQVEDVKFVQELERAKEEVAKEQPKEQPQQQEQADPEIQFFLDNYNKIEPQPPYDKSLEMNLSWAIYQELKKLRELFESKL